MRLMRAAILAVFFTVLGTTALAASPTDLLLARAWPYERYAPLTELGTGVAVVFSPDLSVPGNCGFYRALGFACFDDADWTRVLDGIHVQNTQSPERAIRTLILETHGTNGNGLKLQRSHDAGAERSYISVGALQERLEPDGVRYVIISACNSGRLLRSSIYRSLDPDPGDKLFLPATCGIIDASAGFDAQRSRVTIITPASSHIEMTVVGAVRELAPQTRRLLARSAASVGAAAPKEFAMSDLMMQMITHDRSLRLRVGGGVDALSRTKSGEDVSENLFNALLRRLNELGRRRAAGSW
jgi:hypothetical protein